MKACSESKPIEDMLTILRDSKANERIRDGITANTQLNDDEKRKHIIAARYLNSIEKGINALELSKKIENGGSYIIVPDYIKKAVEWICQ